MVPVKIIYEQLMTDFIKNSLLLSASSFAQISL